MSRVYFNAKAPIWDKAFAEKDTAKLQAIASTLDIKPGSIVLDVGTGTGVFVPFILDKVGQNGKLVCLDIAEEMLKKAKGKGFTGNIKFVCADIVNSRLNSGSFDTVVCYSSFPHFQDKPKALGEINRLLKKGGKLFIFHSSSRDTINRIHRGVPEVCHDLIPDEPEMRRLLAEAGFTDIEIQNETDRFMTTAIKPV